MTRELKPGPDTHASQGLLPTPFHSQLAALSRTQNWNEWSGYLSPGVLTNVEKEYFAIRNQATLADISPMRKYRVTGPAALPMLNRFTVRDVRKIGINRVGYTMWCDEDGMVIDDGTLFRIGEKDFLILCQEYMFTWLQDCASGFEVDVVDMSDAFCGLSLQGPTSYSVLQAAGFSGAEKLKPFDLLPLDDNTWLSRTGYTGDLGYEFLTSVANAHALWERLWDVRHDWGLIAIGFDAVDLVRIEAGYLAPGIDFQPVHRVTRPGRGRSPFELGFGRMVDFGKGHFNGRRALLKLQKQGPRFRLVRLDIAGDKPATNSYVYARGINKEVGFITSAAWSPTTKRNIALAELVAPYGDTVRTGLFADIYINREGKWERREAPATVIDGPFFFNDRAKKVPPDPY